MRRRVLGIFAAAAALSVVAVLNAAPANAASWTISPTGNITGTAGTTVLTDTRSGARVTCTSTTASGNIPAGSDADGLQVAQITGSSWSGCRGPFNISITVTHVGTWQLNAVSYNSGTGVTTGTITSVAANLTGFGCSASVSGSVNATYTNSTAVLQVLTSGSTLVIGSVSGCFGLLANGDGATFSGSFTLSPAVTLTSP